jgi:DNA-binding response OmpR family regulator
MDAMRALVADDEPITRAIVAKTLTTMGFTVDIETDGEAALGWLQRAEGPALAILDWMMPLQFGPDICRRIRTDRPMANIYLILLTALESRQHVVEGLDAGADDYLVKPCDADELRARVRVGQRVLTLQERLADRLAELQAAMANVKQLSGLLPICSYCKRIRGGDQYWQQVEAYIAERSEAQFSHGICPACFETVTKELA